jgi:hypothetical protein
MDAFLSSDVRQGADGESVQAQCRRFEVPAEIAASPLQELQIESGTVQTQPCVSNHEARES